MLENFPFVRDDVLPSWWANALQRFISNLAINFNVVKASNTTLAVPAGLDDEAAIIGIEGKWRWNEATVSRAHPGGAAGEYSVWVVAADNDIRNVPAAGSDFTEYAFELRITALGVPPALVPGTVDIIRDVGTVYWDGAKITGVRQTVGEPAQGGHAIGDVKWSFQDADHGGWKLLDGRTNIPRASVHADFTSLMLGRGYPGNDGATIGLPDVEGRVLMMTDPAGKRISTAGFRTVGATGGEDKHLLTGAESGVNGNGSTTNSGAHQHTNVQGRREDTAGDGVARAGFKWFADGLNAIFQTITNSGSSHSHPLTARNADSSHNNLQPFLVAYCFIYTGDPTLDAGGGGGGSGAGPPNVQAGSYTLTEADAQGVVEIDSAAAAIVTVPAAADEAFSIGDIIEVTRMGAGTVTIEAAAGVTIVSPGGLLAIADQFGAVSLRCRATDEWHLVGGL